MLTFLIPANLFVVVQTSLASEDAGQESSARASPRGDAFIPGWGFSVWHFITQCEAVFSLIKIVGGAYLLWFARNGIRHPGDAPQSCLQTPIAAPWTIFFRRGLMTDLSNPPNRCFYQYFSVTLSAKRPHGQVNICRRN
ncbi:LysE family transporter [Salmonella enterica subsp. enterica]|nr:LysE family transporter [Salmonella enterica subsp. enterica]